MRVKSQEGCYRRPLQGPKKKELARTQVQAGALVALNMPSIILRLRLLPLHLFLLLPMRMICPPFTHLELNAPGSPVEAKRPSLIIIDL